MNVGLLGLGYWGSIILKTLDSFDGCNVKIYDPHQSKEFEKDRRVDDYSDLLACDYIVIASPSNSHYNLCKFFLEKGKHIFCEKPLTNDKFSTIDLYNIADSNGCKLFVDWIFTYNPNITHLKNIYNKGQLGRIKSVSMNRLNKGPSRYDCSAKWDLSSHDVSILQFLFEEKPRSVKWLDLKRNQDSKFPDSSLGVLVYPSFFAHINSSWEYPKKDRRCVFEFDKDVIVWDDTKQKMTGELLDYSVKDNADSPLKRSLSTFFDLNFTNQKYLTIDTTEILNNGENFISYEWQ